MLHPMDACAMQLVEKAAVYTADTAAAAVAIESTSHEGGLLDPRLDSTGGSESPYGCTTTSTIDMKPTVDTAPAAAAATAASAASAAAAAAAAMGVPWALADLPAIAARSTRATPPPLPPPQPSTPHPFACTAPACGRTFAKRSNLTAHARLHSNVRPYPCPIPGCGKRFRWMSALAPHTRMHARAAAAAVPRSPAQLDAARVYACGVCGRRFARRTSVTNHERSHGNVRSAVNRRRRRREEGVNTSAGRGGVASSEGRSVAFGVSAVPAATPSVVAASTPWTAPAICSAISGVAVMDNAAGAAAATVAAAAPTPPAGPPPRVYPRGWPPASLLLPCLAADPPASPGSSISPWLVSDRSCGESRGVRAGAGGGVPPRVPLDDELPPVPTAIATAGSGTDVGVGGYSHGEVGVAYPRGVESTAWVRSDGGVYARSSGEAAYARGDATGLAEGDEMMERTLQELFEL
ncbi:hypothetical protein MMPV_003398 [Pyropia vietnamensis]